MQEYKVGDKVRLVKFIDSLVFGSAELSTKVYGPYLGREGVVLSVDQRSASLEVHFPETDTMASDTFDVHTDEVELVND